MSEWNDLVRQIRNDWTEIKPPIYIQPETVIRGLRAAGRRLGLRIECKIMPHGLQAKATVRHVRVNPRELTAAAYHELLRTCRPGSNLAHTLELVDVKKLK